MRDLSYKTIFGKTYTHEESLIQNVRDAFVNILAEENNVSEKSFKQYDKIIEEAKELITDDVTNEVVELYSNGKRIKYIAEYLYDKLKNTNINESIIVKFGEFNKKS